MKLVITILLFLYVINYNHVSSATLPNNLRPCSVSDTNFSDCLGKSIESAIKTLKEKGISELKIKPINPPFIPQAIIPRGKLVDLTQNYSDVNIYGLLDVTYVKVKKVDVKHFYIELEAFHPYTRWDAHYEANGKLLLLPLYGNGKANIILYNTTAQHIIAGDFFTKKGNTYAKCTEYKFLMEPQKVQFKVDNLFNGNKLLGDNMQKILNDNWKDLFQDSRISYEAVIGELLKSYVNMIFNRIPYNVIFKDE